MKIIVCKNYEEMSKQAAKLVISQVTLKPELISSFNETEAKSGVPINIIFID